jgi:hypothetical protein
MCVTRIKDRLYITRAKLMSSKRKAASFDFKSASKRQRLMTSDEVALARKDRADNRLKQADVDIASDEVYLMLLKANPENAERYKESKLRDVISKSAMVFMHNFDPLVPGETPDLMKNMVRISSEMITTGREGDVLWDRCCRVLRVEVPNAPFFQALRKKFEEMKTLWGIAIHLDRVQVVYAKIEPDPWNDGSVEMLTAEQIGEVPQDVWNHWLSHLLMACDPEHTKQKMDTAFTYSVFTYK